MRLRELSEPGRAERLLSEAWQRHQGTLIRGVSWDRQPLEELLEIVRCVGGGLPSILGLLAEDHAGWMGGMPDLLLWNPGKGKARLSEVKGPRDRLSEQQRAWLLAMNAAGVDCELCRVLEESTQHSSEYTPQK